MEIVGAVLSTVNVAELEDIAALLPAKSVAVPASRSIPTVPSPVQFERVTVLVVVPEPATTIVRVAPEVFKLTSEQSEIELAPV